MRQLKYHEQKLLKKVDFLNWKQDKNLREVKILRRYHIQDREDYHTYNKVVGYITKVERARLASHANGSRPRGFASDLRVSCSRAPRALSRPWRAHGPQMVTLLKALDPKDPKRSEMTDQLLDKLYSLGLIQNKRLAACDKIAASTLCRRRLPVVLVRLKFSGADPWRHQGV